MTREEIFYNIQLLYEHLSNLVFSFDFQEKLESKLGVHCYKFVFPIRQSVFLFARADSLWGGKIFREIPSVVTVERKFLLIKRIRGYIATQVVNMFLNCTSITIYLNLWTFYFIIIIHAVNMNVSVIEIFKVFTIQILLFFYFIEPPWRDLNF